MRNEKGSTLLQLIVYMAGAIVLMLALSSATVMYLRHIVKMQAKCEIERDYAVFNRFFIQDMKESTTSPSIEVNTVRFSGGTIIYESANQQVTRNGVVILKNVESFSASSTVVNTKTVITVDMRLRKQTITLERENEYVYGRGYG